MKKKKSLVYLLILFFVLILFLIIESVSLFSTVKLTKEAAKNLVVDIINNQPENFDTNFQTWQNQTVKLKRKLNQVRSLEKLLPKKANTLINQAKTNLDQFSELNKFLAEMVAKNGQKTYFVLLQNNLELRPSGGFIGSYAKIKFKNGGMQDIIVQDIYVPDGQLKGHVDPPWPIQAAFKQGWWKLRDSNWDPDFPAAAEQIQWFFEKGGEEKADGLIALNLLVIKDLLKIAEPLIVPDYDYQITADNLYQIAQNEAERDFFPGSSQKKDFLSTVSKHLILKLKTINSEQTLQLIKLIKKNLYEKQILISFNDPLLAQFFSQLNWNGSVKRNYQDSKELVTDYLFIVDTNLGANKANCCVERKVTQEINIEKSGLIKEKLKITYINSSPKERPKPPLFWGGLYENFLRIILPIEVENIEIKVNGQTFKEKIEIKNDQEKKLKTIGFFVNIPPLSQSLIEITYQKKGREIKHLTNYLLELQKQSGIESYSHFIKIQAPEKQSLIEKNLRTDEVIKIVF